jgi:hypothetical protein
VSNVQEMLTQLRIETCALIEMRTGNKYKALLMSVTLPPPAIDY